MKKSVLIYLSLSLVFFIACNKDDNTPTPVNEDELITTVRVTFTPQAGGDPLIFSSTDLDGEGANAPVIVNDTLADSTIYRVRVEFLNELENPVENITQEVKDEGDEHQVFFEFSNGLNLLHLYDDTDVNGQPIGLTNNIETRQTGSGSMKLTLRHQPNKNAAGVASGDITNAGGSTDVEVIFQVVIR